MAAPRGSRGSTGADGSDRRRQQEGVGHAGPTTRLRRAARRRVTRAQDERQTRWSALRRWTTATVASAAAGAVGAVAVNLATSAQEKATSTVRTALFGDSEHSTLSSAAGPTVSLDVKQGMDCQPAHGWLFPDAAAKTTVPPGKGSRRGGHAWNEDPAAFGAVTADPVTLFFTATGKTDHAVVLTGLKFHVTKHRPALHGVVLNAEGHLCALSLAGGTRHYTKLDLSSKTPYRVENPGPPPNVRSDAVKFPYNVTADDPESFQIEVTTGSCDCTWYAELEWVDGHKPGSTVFKDHGKNFRTTGSTGLESATWEWKAPTPRMSPARSGG
jgi:hypothetical protein